MPAAILTEPILATPQVEAPAAIRISEVLVALSYALDLTEGQPAGHSVRSCVIGMHLAAEIGLEPARQGDLYYAKTPAAAATRRAWRRCWAATT